MLSKGDLLPTTRLILNQKRFLIVLEHKSYLEISERDAFRENKRIIPALTISEVASEVPLEACSVIGCLAIDCQTSIRGAYPDKIFVSHLSLYFISNVLELCEIALIKNSTLTLDL